VNKSSLELISDNQEGLPVRQGGDWTYEKLYFLAEYIKRFIVSMRPKEWRAINYIDLYSGSGKNCLPDDRIILGSPLIALGQIPSFDNYYLSDLDPKNISSLQQRCANSINADKIKFETGDANKIVEKITNELNKQDKKFIKGKFSTLNLAFLDPEGLELHWTTVEKLAKFRTDLIIYYSQMGITRNGENEINQNPNTPIDLFFGDTNWRKIYKSHQYDVSGVHRPLMDYYKNKLAAFGYQIDEPLEEPVFKNSKDAPMFRLLFASKSPLGNKFWNDATSRLLNEQGRLF